MPIKVKDLKSYISTKGPRSLLKCSVCGNEWSADQGDYFMASPDTILECCNTPLKRFIMAVSYEEI